MPVLSEATTKKRYFGTQEIVKSYKGSSLIWNKPVATTSLDVFSTNHADLEGVSFESGEVYTKIFGGGLYMRSYAGAVEANGEVIYRRGPAERTDNVTGVSFKYRLGSGSPRTGVRFLMQPDGQGYGIFYSYNVLVFTRRTTSYTSTGQIVDSNIEGDIKDFYPGRILDVTCTWADINATTKQFKIFIDGQHLATFNRPINEFTGTSVGLFSIGNTINNSNGHVITQLDLIKG